MFPSTFISLRQPSRLGQTLHHTRSRNARPYFSREESDLSDLVARLSIQDIEELEDRQKGKRKKGAFLTDAELALSIFAEDARALIQFNRDRALAEALNEMGEPPLQFGTIAMGNVR